MNAFQIQQVVHPEWVDYNGHMNDAEYAKVFSIAVDEFMKMIGLDNRGRETFDYTIFTLETHLCYLKEAHEGEYLSVTTQILDVDEKRIHIFFNMENEQGELISTSEQMLMGMNTKEARPGPFPKPINEKVQELYSKDREKSQPIQAGRTIGIRQK